MLATFEHLRHKFIAGKHKEQPLWIILPHKIAHQTKLGNAVFFFQINQSVVLRFFCFAFHSVSHYREGKIFRKYFLFSVYEILTSTWQIPDSSGYFGISPTEL